MAQKVHVVLEDDLDGGEAAETVTFGLDGTTYEIDLNENNAAALRDALAAYVGNARRAEGGSSSKRPRRSSSRSTVGGNNGHSAREIRDWARSNGHTVPERGRIPGEVRKAFDEAH